MSVPLACLNGQLLPLPDAMLPLNDAGFASGATVVDSCRTYRHRLFCWPDHQVRFRRDCDACFVPLPPSDQALTGFAEELVAHNAALIPAESDLGLVVFATPGPLPHFLGRTGPAGPSTWGMHTFPLSFERYRPYFAEGVTLLIPGYQAADADSLLPPGVKHRSRMLWWVADQLVRRRPGAPSHALALLTDGPRGNVTETAIGNFLLVREGVIHSPPPGTVLDGISLGVVRELCGELGIPYREAPIPLAACATAQEGLICGTAFGLAGVRRIEDWALPWPGTVLRRLLAAWSQRVGLDIGRQISG